MTCEVNFDPKKHEYSDALGVVIPSVTQVLAKAGICDFSFVDEETRQHSMKRGTSVHWMTRLEDEGALRYRRLTLRMRLYRLAYVTWKRNSGFFPVEIEYPRASVYGFAGTPDRIGTLPHQQWIVLDLKTGEIADHVRYQLAAYAALASERCGWHPSRIRRIALRLKDDGTYKVREFPTANWPVDWAKFIEALKEVENAKNA